MSPPEIWGPPIWTLFHSLTSQINQNAYPRVVGPMFSIISRICKYLPCPECSRDATMALAKVDLNNYKTKESLRDMFYLFHNWVNSKKRKSLYNSVNMVKYSRLNLIAVVNKFIVNYNTKGNMSMLTESFQRDFVLNDFKKWFRYYRMGFLPDMIINNPEPVNISQNSTDENNLEPVETVETAEPVEPVETVETVTNEEQTLYNSSESSISENSVDDVQEYVDTNSDETEVINELESEAINELESEAINELESEAINELESEVINENETSIQTIDEFQEITNKKRKPRKKKTNSKK